LEPSTERRPLLVGSKNKPQEVTKRVGPKRPIFPKEVILGN